MSEKAETVWRPALPPDATSAQKQTAREYPAPLTIVNR